MAWTLRRAPRAAAPAPTPAPARSVLPGTRQENLVYRQFRGEKESLLLKARTFVGQENEELRFEGVEVTLSYTSRGERGQAVISSDRCVYDPAPQRAVFEGNVVVRTQDGLELQTASLVYRGDKGLAKTDDAAEFRRKDLSGTSTGMVYQAEEGRLELLADAVVRIQDEDQPATEVRSRRAVVERAEGRVRFEEAVELTRGRDHLTSERLTVEFGADDVVHRAQALGGVVLRTAGDLPGATVAGGGRGERHLTALRLDVSFRPDRTVSEAVAGPDADLTLLPGPGEPRERRRLRGRFLIFRFDEEGRLNEVQGQREASFSAEQLPPGKTAPRTLTCQGFVARLEPSSGLAESIEFTRDVEFVQGGRKASAQRASYEGASGKLLLRQSPVVVDEDRGWRLAAVTIEVATGSGDVRAQEEVRNTMRSPRSGAKGFLSGPDTVATCRLFEYREKTRTAIYRDDALLRSGKDEVRAWEIRVQDLQDGRRRLEADSDVTSLLHPRGASTGSNAPAPVEASARSMRYDEAAARVVYRGDVTIRQGDIETRSPEATLTLTPDGAALERLVAGEPVEVRQGERTASGRRGTYTPADETMVLVGERVLLKDPSQELQGRSVTFHVGDDRVLVDGRQEVRTQAVFKKEVPQP